MDDLLPLTLVKKHLNLVHDDDDDYLAQLSAAAIGNFATFTGQVLMPLTTDSADMADSHCRISPDIQMGALLLIGQWYANREITGEKNLTALPAVTYDLWSPYVIYHLGDPGA